MEIISSIDPFIMQLVIVPLVVIGIGVILAVLFKRVILAPIVTFLINASYEMWRFNYKYPEFTELEQNLTVWNIFFPVISFFVALLLVPLFKNKRNEKNATTSN